MSELAQPDNRQTKLETGSDRKDRSVPGRSQSSRHRWIRLRIDLGWLEFIDLGPAPSADDT